MTVQAMLQLKQGDIVSAELESGYIVFVRVAFLDPKGVHGPRVYTDNRESQRQYVIPAKRLKKLLARRDERGYDIPVAGG